MSSAGTGPQDPAAEGDPQAGRPGGAPGDDGPRVPAGAHPEAAHRRTGGVPPPWARGSDPPGENRSAEPGGQGESRGAGGSARPAPAADDTTGTTGTADAGGPDGTGWRRLPALMLVVAPGTALLKFAPALIVLLLFGAGRGSVAQLWIAAGIAVLAVLAGVVRWRTTRYRITPDRVELHSGLLNRQRRSVPRDRIRTVDLTAPLLHRLVGVSVVKVGSGQSAGKESGVDLDAVTTAEAERLRRELLARPTAQAGTTGSGIAGAGIAGTDGAGTDTAGTSAAGTVAAGTGPAGTGDAGTGAAGTGAAGTGAAGTGDVGTGDVGTGDVGTGAGGIGAAGTGAGRIGAAGTGAGGASAGVTEPEPGEELDRLDWASLRYAPLTVSSLAAIGALAGAGWNLLNEADVDPRALPGADAVTGGLSAAPIWAAALAGVLALLVLMVAGSIVLFVERWWGFRLTREPDGTLRVLRGLLTRRSLSVSEQRLRGVTVSEPLLVRAVGRGAQAGALTVGLAGAGGEEAHAGALGPPVPRAHAHHIAATAARAGADITSGPLVEHPSAARTRRLIRAAGPALLLPVAAGVLAYLGGPAWPIAVAVLLVAAAVPLGLDRYRALGHRLDERYLVAREGSLLRTTAALRRDGVIGWRIRQSVFQLRAGVVTLEATTAAGTGAVQILDLSPTDAVALMAEVTPDAVAGFRESAITGGARTDSG